MRDYTDPHLSKSVIGFAKKLLAVEVAMQVTLLVTVVFVATSAVSYGLLLWTINCPPTGLKPTLAMVMAV